MTANQLPYILPQGFHEPPPLQKNLHLIHAHIRFLPWPEEALTAVSSRFLDTFEALEAGPELRSALQRMMASVHMQARTGKREGFVSCQRCSGAEFRLSGL